MLAQHRQQAGLRVNVNRITMPINRETNRRHFEAPFEECVRRFRQKILPRMIPPRGPQILSVVIPQRDRKSLPFVIPTRGLIARGICFSPPSNPPRPLPRAPQPPIIAPAMPTPHTAPTPKFLTEADVRARLRMPDLIDTMQQALVEFSSGRVQQPVRTVLKYGTEAALFGLMPSFAP